MSDPKLGKKKNSFHDVQKFSGSTSDVKKLSYAAYLQTASLTAIKER